MAYGAGHASDAALDNGFSLRTFLHHEAFSGVLLLVCAVIALLWANSPWHHGYEALWETELGLELGSWHFGESLRHWINDGLMAIFFLVVGLEIKREVLVADLAFASLGEGLTLAAAKVGVLAASVFAGIGGWLVLRRATR